MGEWRYDKPNNDRYVLGFGRAGHLIAYWSDGDWWEAWSGDPLGRARPWAWQELIPGCPCPDGPLGSLEPDWTARCSQCGSRRQSRILDQPPEKK